MCIWNHLKDIHEIDSFKLKKDLASNNISFDDYARMRLVNFCRGNIKNGYSIERIVSEITTHSDLWKSVELLNPVDPDDRLLWEEAPSQIMGDDEEEEDGMIGNDIINNVVIDEPSDSMNNVDSLKAEVLRLRALLKTSLNNDDSDSDSEVAKKSSNRTKTVGPVSIIKDEATAAAAIERREFAKKEDINYFESYSFDDIHRVMILDQIRTGSYKSFLTQNPEHIRGKTVLDIGCGSGILSMFCAAAGAARVVGLDAAASTAAKARKNIELNGFQDKVQVVVGKVEDMDLFINTETELVEPFARGDKTPRSLPDKYVPFCADVLVSEWMGYALLFEGMLYSVLDARDRWLVDGGLVIPSQTTLSVHGVDYSQDWRQERDWFKPGVSTFGLDLQMLQPNMKKILETPEIEVVSTNRICTGMLELCTIDLALVSADCLRQLRVPFEFKAEDKSISSFALSFDTIFETKRRYVKANVGLSSGPHAGVRTRSVLERCKTGIRWRRISPTFQSEIDSVDGGDEQTSWFSHGDKHDKIACRLVEEPAQDQSVVVFGTSPEDPPTHWKQTVLHFWGQNGDAASLEAGQCMRGWFAVAPASANPRHVTITMEIEDCCSKNLKGMNLLYTVSL